MNHKDTKFYHNPVTVPCVLEQFSHQELSGTGQNRSKTE